MIIKTFFALAMIIWSWCCYADVNNKLTVTLSKVQHKHQFRCNFMITFTNNTPKPYDVGGLQEEIPFEITFQLANEKKIYRINHKYYGADGAYPPNVISANSSKQYFVDFLGDYTVDTGIHQSGWVDSSTMTIKIPFRDFARGKKGILTFTLDTLRFRPPLANIVVFSIPWDGAAFDIDNTKARKEKPKESPGN